MQASQTQYPYTHKPILVTGSTIYGKTFAFRLDLWGKFCGSMFVYFDKDIICKKICD